MSNNNNISTIINSSESIKLQPYFSIQPDWELEITAALTQKSSANNGNNST